MRALLVLLVAVGCGNSATGTNTPPPEPQPQEAAPQSLRPLMSKHFARVTATQLAIIDGNLAKAKVQARAIADEPAPDGLPTTWRPHYDQLQAAARATADAANVVDAAEKVAAMGGACGSCHRDLGVTIEMASEAPPTSDGGAVDAMRLHQWAADKMWDGLILPSEERWLAGVKALEEAPLTTSELTRPGPIDPELARAVEQIRGWAKIAGESPDPDTRQHIYGHFLSSCASCHAAHRRAAAPRAAH
jgi:cytochrome c553